MNMKEAVESELVFFKTLTSDIIKKNVGKLEYPKRRSIESHLSVAQLFSLLKKWACSALSEYLYRLIVRGCFREDF